MSARRRGSTRRQAIRRAANRRMARQEEMAVHFRLGVVTDTSPLDVAVGGASTSYTDVRSIEGQTFQADDVVAVLQWRGDLIVLGVIA